MIVLDYSNRVSNFIDAADVGGNIKNSPDNLLYLNHIDSSCREAGIISGAIYPMVGGTATSHSFNFLNSSQYQITWSGTTTHDISGATSNGTTGFGNTGINPNSLLDINNFSLINVTNKTVATVQSEDIGAISAGDNNALLLGRTTTGGYLTIGNNTGRQSFTHTSTSPSVVITSKINNNIILNTDNNITSITTAYIPLFTTLNIYIMVRNNDNALAFFSTRTQKLIGITNGLALDKSKVFSHNIYNAQRILNRA